jgi:transposase
MEYGAIDLHAKESQIRIVTSDGRVVLDQRIATRRDRFTWLFGERPAMRILLETGTESEWVAQHLESLGHEVVVADPNYAPMYGERTRRIKTDKRDVAALAEANRREIYRPAHRVSIAQRDVRRRLRVRTHLVGMRRQVISVMRAHLRAEGLRLRSGAAESMLARYRTMDDPAALRETFAPLLALLETLEPLIRQADQWAKQQATRDPVTARLTTAPGVGPIVALSFRATLDDVTRFSDAGHLPSYLGLVPRESSSGDRRCRGAITKAGPGHMRTLLLQAAWTVWRTPSGSAALHAWVRRLGERRGRKVAVVGLARRLARILFAMWRDGHLFQPTRLTRITVAA